MFPSINHINDLLPYIEANPQFRVQVQPNGFTVVCYMLQDEDTFRGEHDAFYKECRGITFDVHGRVASRTLHKFQNVGENEQTRADQIPWNRIVRVTDKRDGSMITPVLMPDGSIVCKTKKTFTSSEAIEATKFLNADIEKVEWVTTLLRNGLTPTFEWTSPRFPIVLQYEKDELTLLQVRKNMSGEYIIDLEGAFKICPFPIVQNLIDRFSSGGEVMWPHFANEQLQTTGVEGWIVQADDGQMWKVKTKWYCDLHHSVTFTRWRDIARSVLDDQSDDLKGAFAMTGRDIGPIVKVEKTIKAKCQLAEALARAVVAAGAANGLDAKGMALLNKDNPLFGQIMAMFRGKTINWMEWYEKNHLKNDWGLEVVGNVNEDAEVPEVKEEE